MTRSGFHPVGTRDRVLFELLPLASVNWLKAIISRIAAWRSWSDRAAKPSVILARPATPGFYRAMSFRVRMRSIFSASVRDCVIGCGPQGHGPAALRPCRSGEERDGEGERESTAGAGELDRAVASPWRRASPLADYTGLSGFPCAGGHNG